MSSSPNRWLALTYATAIFVSAFLLFQIQPLISKRILPWFGGSSAVWTTCLLFFQTFLFAGYAYAHWTSGWLKPRQQAWLHVALIVAALVLTRALPGEKWEPTGTEQPASQILLILTVSIGMPYFVLSATGPLLQAWFARSFPGRIPYRLYALSNVGSLLALLSYPFFFEPALDLPRQAQLWTGGFIAFAALCSYIAWQVVKIESSPSARGNKSEPSPSGRGQGEGALKTAGTSPRMNSSKKHTAAPAAEEPAPRWWHYVLWLVLAAFGSVTLMATTNHVSTDLAVMPLLWVVPLSIYLVTFIIAFDRPAWYRRTPIAVLALISIYAAAMTHHLRIGEVKWFVAGTPGLIYSHFASGSAGSQPTFDLTPTHFLLANFVALFAICWLCHGEIVRTRPATRYLTSFYLMISAGGALGGIFTSLIAPNIFSQYFEWDGALAIALLASIVIILRACIRLVSRDREHERRPTRYALLAFVVLAVFLPTAVLLVDMRECLFNTGRNVRWRARNFFGALAIFERYPDEELLRRFVLVHGTITHGSQFTNEVLSKEPTTYYARNSGVGRTIDFFHKHLEPGELRIGAVGLGTGTLAAYPKAGESITFYEINPIDIGVAEEGTWFTYLRDCRKRGAHYDIRLGDARLTLRREIESNFEARSGEGPSKQQPYHLIVLDAFSGDSIPVHLLTTQAFEIYLKCITDPPKAPNEPNKAGVIAVHVSNRYLDLEPVVRAIAGQFELRPLRISNPDDRATDTYDAEWILLTRNNDLAAELVQFVTPVQAIKPPVLWTDDRSSIFEILR